MTTEYHSITAFDRKHLAPKMDAFLAAREDRRQNRTIALVVIAVIGLTAFHYFILPGLLHSIAPGLF